MLLLLTVVENFIKIPDLVLDSDMIIYNFILIFYSEKKEHENYITKKLRKLRVGLAWSLGDEMKSLKWFSKLLGWCHQQE